MDFLELADYVVVGLALLLGVGIGRRMRVKPPEPLRAVCTCSHGFGQHEDGGKCQGEVKRADKWDEDTNPRHWEYAPCRCTRYDGPSLGFLGHVDLP